MEQLWSFANKEWLNEYSTWFISTAVSSLLESFDGASMYIAPREFPFSAAQRPNFVATHLCAMNGMRISTLFTVTSLYIWRDIILACINKS